MVCSSALMYADQAVNLECSYCGKAEQGHIRCPNGHYICDACHNKEALQVIEDIAFATLSKNPFEIADRMMSYPGLPMLGCQHAYIAGGAFMAAIKNEGSHGAGNEQIKEVFERTGRQAVGGYCGLTGVCGISPAMGACYAVLTGSKCGADSEQKKTMESVNRVSQAIAELTGPSCCKAYVRASLETAVAFLRETLGVTLPVKQETGCIYTLRHPHGCRLAKCPYF
jgi:hypothetical protein